MTTTTTDPDTAARIRALIDDARCRGCGATNAECERLYRDNAPDPIGCCQPHDHTVRLGDLARLADRIGAGQPDPAPAKPSGINVWAYLNQGTTWHPKPPAGPVPIATMDPTWRWNASQLLLRRAPAMAWRYGFTDVCAFGGAPDEVFDELMREDAERQRDPQTWMRTTTLYRVLVADLPSTRRALTHVAGRARHFSTCPRRRRNGSGACVCAPTSPPVDPAAVNATLAVIAAIKADAERVAQQAAEAAEAAERERVVAERRAWMAAHPGLDPGTGRSWGVDEDGIDHHEPHPDNQHCQFDSCAGCGGYHCGLLRCRARFPRTGLPVHDAMTCWGSCPEHRSQRNEDPA